MEFDHRTTQSIFCWLLQTIVRPFRPHLVTPKKTYPYGSIKLTPHKKVFQLGRVTERKDGELWVYDINASGLAEPIQDPSQRTRLYYFAGSGWQGPPSSQHWLFCTELARRVPGLTVTVVSPPLAPKSPAPTTFPILEKWYTIVLERARQAGERVIIGGDSSGGNIALCLALSGLMKDVPSPKPHAVLLISPAVDLRPTKKEGKVMKVAKKDPVLTIAGHDSEAKAWAGDADPASAWISPITADIAVLARAGLKVIGVTGSYDLLSISALQLRDAAEAAGAQGSWLDWDKQMHCFPLTFMYGLPEGKASIEWIVEKLSSL